jgi:KDO2-lipid IV(A) lauroyltransferase
MIFAFDDAGKNLEYWLVVAVARSLGRMPRGLARLLAGRSPGAVLRPGRLRRVGARNLELALPDLSAPKKHNRILRGVFRHLGWQLVEFCRMPRYTAENTRGWIRTEGLDHYLAAKARGKGVLVLTGHLGAWELSSFYHSLMGHPMGMVIRRLDNRRLDDFVNGIRCLHGNQVLHKDDFARGLLTAMHRRDGGHSDGHQHDPAAGRVCELFRHPGLHRLGLARVALKTGAAVLPGFMLWEEAEQQYVLHFGPELVFQNTRETQRPIFWPPRSSATMRSKPGFGAILTSGYGFIAAGRQGRRGSRGSTDIRVQHLHFRIDKERTA